MYCTLIVLTFISFEIEHLAYLLLLYKIRFLYSLTVVFIFVV